MGPDLVVCPARGQPRHPLGEGSSSILNRAVGLGVLPTSLLFAEGLMVQAQWGAAFCSIRVMGTGWLARLAQLTPSLPVRRSPPQCHVGTGGQSRLHHCGSDGPDPHAAVEREW